MFANLSCLSVPLARARLPRGTALEVQCARGPHARSTLITKVRRAKTAAEERAIIKAESAYLRTALAHEGSRFAKRNLVKLMYLRMLGYPAAFGQVPCLALITQGDYSAKARSAPRAVRPPRDRPRYSADPPLPCSSRAEGARLSCRTFASSIARARFAGRHGQDRPRREGPPALPQGRPPTLWPCGPDADAMARRAARRLPRARAAA